MNEAKETSPPVQKEPMVRADWTTRLNKSRTADYAIVFLALFPAVLLYYNAFSPEASVYFTYFKTFFTKPFTFQPDTVAFGAASPLNVLLHAPIYALFGDHWILASKLVNFLLVALGAVILTRAIKGGIRSVLLTSFFVVLSTGMLSSVSQLSESGLAFFAMALLYHDVLQKNFERALLICGSAYLIRAELAILGLVVAFWIMIQSEQSRKLMPWLIAGFAPVLIYHGYMLFETGSLVPSGAMAALVSYIQEPVSWYARLSQTGAALWSAEGLIYLCGAVALLLMVAEWSVPRYTRELLLIAPLGLLYLVLPPGEPVVRYLVPLLPALIALLVRYIEKELKVQHSGRALLVSLCLAHLFGVATLSASAPLDRSSALLEDLSSGINRLAGPTDHVLLYDIQGQYNIASPCHGLSGAVGDELVDVMLRRENISDFILQNNVRFLVTSDALGQRPLYENTMLAELYSMDYRVTPGDTLYLGGLAMQKEFSNSAFMRSIGSPTSGAPLASSADGVHPHRWNSVYRVLGTQSAVEAGKALAALSASPGMTNTSAGPGVVQP